MALALVAWFFFSFTEKERLSETTLEPFVQYNTGRNYLVLNPVEKVRVRLRGPASRVSVLNPVQVSVVVDLRDQVEGTKEVALGARNVSAPDGLELVSIEPNLIPLQIDRVTNEMKPVDANLSGEPAAGAQVQTPEVIPPAVLVNGPVSRLSQIGALTTTPVQLDGHALDFEETVAVVSPDPLVRVVQPAVVTVRVPLAIPGPGPGGRDQP
jgi:YbbR domain-containing protein